MRFCAPCQPCALGGPRKGLKTSVIIEAAIALATSTPFLGRFNVLRSCRTGVMTGESQFSTIQKNARAVSYAHGYDLENIDGIVWSDKLPVFGSIRHIDGLEKWITGNEIEVLFIDPAYLCIPTVGREGSVFAMGELLRSISEPCQARGVTLVIAHHTTKEATRSLDPPELDWLSWSGFAEFARQWWLLGRRAKYVPGTYQHAPWLSIGGSAGHSSLWAANIFEGSRHDRRWDVELLRPDDLTQSQKSAKETAKDAEIQERIQRDKATILQAVLKLLGQQGTKKDIKARSGLNTNAFEPPFNELIDAGDLVEIEIRKGNKQTYQGYKLGEHPE